MYPTIDIKIIELSCSVTEIGSIKDKNQFLHIIFLNKDISITISDSAMKFSMALLQIHYEGSLSQISYLGLSFYFMLFRKYNFENIQKVTRFFM